MIGSGRTVAVLGGVAVVAAALFGTTAAVAEQEPVSPGLAAEDPTALLEDLDALEAQLPVEPPPAGVTIDEEAGWGRVEGDAGGMHAVLDTLEPELRQLFVEADDADGEVGEAVALVTRGWLDVWQGLGALTAWETHDLAFPVDTVDDQDVATGADEIRSQAEKGLELILRGRERHLAGYTLLRELGEAEPVVQARLDARAVQAEAFDLELRPVVARLLSRPSVDVVVPTGRFDTVSSGVDARARSLQIRCVDREALEALTDTLSEETLAALEAVTPHRDDCADAAAATDLP